MHKVELKNTLFNSKYSVVYPHTCWCHRLLVLPENPKELDVISEFSSYTSLSKPGISMFQSYTPVFLPDDIDCVFWKRLENPVKFKKRENERMLVWLANWLPVSADFIVIDPLFMNIAKSDFALKIEVKSDDIMLTSHKSFKGIPFLRDFARVSENLYEGYHFGMIFIK